MMGRVESAIDRPAPSRRAVIVQVGLAVAAVEVLSACTDRGPGVAVLSTPDTDVGGASVIRPADIPVGSGRIYADLEAVVTQPTAGDFRAFGWTCTHQSCPVTDITDTINCLCHGSRFSLTDGSVVNPPADEPLPARLVTVSGDRITLT